MLFAGDLAAPDINSSRLFRASLTRNKDIFNGKTLICNLEGLIVENFNPGDDCPLLSNHPSAIDSFKSFVNPVFVLANNHIHDFPGSFGDSVKFLEKLSIPFTGASYISEGTPKTLKFYEKESTVYLINACWDFLLYNHKNPYKGIAVREIKERQILEEVRSLKHVNEDCRIVVFLHWNFDMEILPFPSYREFAHDLIDSGADVIIGTHSHCIQGGEKYKNGYILYGLGNFFIPHNVFINGKLAYPDFSREELVFEWLPENNSAACHWFRYENENGNHNLIYKGTERFEESKTMASYSVYSGMSNSEYLKYFKQHRRKKFLIPIFKNYKSVRWNRLLTILLKTRARIARQLARFKVIKWQN